MNGKQYEIRTASVTGGPNNSYAFTAAESAQKAEVDRLNNLDPRIAKLVADRNRPNYGGDHAEPIGQTISKMKKRRKLNPGGHAFKGTKHGFKHK